MPQSIEDTLKLLDVWFKEPHHDTDRPKLLSKLALLELCGWLEGTFDELILHADKLTLKDQNWTKQSVMKNVSGFDYGPHLRGMLTKLVGETFAKRVESCIDTSFPGDLDLLKSKLGTLWTKRCMFAHNDMVSHIASQTTFDAPSWTLAQYRTLVPLIAKYRNAVTTTLNGI